MIESTSVLKLIHCVVKVDDLENMVDALKLVTTGLTVWESRESGQGVSRKAYYRGQTYETPAPGMILEIVTDESWVSDILQTILGEQKGKLVQNRPVCVLPVEQSYHIRNGALET